MMPSKAITVGAVKPPRLSRDGRTMVVSIPISMRRTGGRRKVVVPANAAPWSLPPARVDSTITKALARAHRWRSMLESNLFATVRDLSRAEKINEAYLCRVLRLTLLSPNITEAVLSGRLPDSVDLARLLKPFPTEWQGQEALFLAERGCDPPASTSASMEVEGINVEQNHRSRRVSKGQKKGKR